VGSVNSLQKAIVAHFNSNVTSLPPLRMGRQPQGTPRPYAAYDHIDNQPQDAFSSSRWSDFWVYQFAVFGSRAAVVAGLEAIHSAFNRASLTLDTGSCRSVLRVSTGVRPEPQESSTSDDVFMGWSRYRFIVDN
jgi:hypothetical protein